MRILFIVSFLCVFSVASFAQIRVSSGRVERHPLAPKNAMLGARNIDVWLPEGFVAGGKYKILILHDGQMLFDTTHTWNHQEWGVDETMHRLRQQNKILPCIVVGVWNRPSHRRAELWPQKALSYLTSPYKDSVLLQFPEQLPLGDAYLDFVVAQVLPFVCSTYNIKSDKNNTFMAGSSMGGLMSMYAQCEYPEVFGGVACLSTHWVGFVRDPKHADAVAAAFLAYLSAHLPDRKHKFYFDHGDQTLDQYYGPYQTKVDAFMQKKVKKRNYRSLFFAGTDHSEKAWAARLADPITFLLRH